MRKKEFLEELEKNLQGIPKEDVKEILEDYEEHFRVGKKKKRKETEIAESLGNPKEIAKEAKKELGEEISFKEEIKKAGIYIESFSKDVWKSIKETFRGEYPQAKKTIKEGFESFEETVKKTFKKKKKGKKIFRKILLITANILIVFPIWIALFFSLMALIISGWSVVFVGLAIILSMIFSLAMSFSTPLNNLLFSGIFMGAGIFFLGNILSSLFWRLNKLYFKATKGYFKWNKKFFRGGKNESKK